MSEYKTKYVDIQAFLDSENRNNVYDHRDLMEKLEAFPADDVEPVVRGEWKEFDADINAYVCSVCDEPYVLIDGTPKQNHYNYCPNCGAHMEAAAAVSDENYRIVSADEIESKLRMAIIEQIPTARLRELAEAEQNQEAILPKLDCKTCHWRKDQWKCNSCYGTLTPENYANWYELDDEIKWERAEAARALAEKGDAT